MIRSFALCVALGWGFLTAAAVPDIVFVRTVQGTDLFDRLTQPSRTRMRQACSPFVGPRDLKDLRIEPDLATHSAGLKASVERVFSSPTFGPFFDQWVHARRSGSNVLTESEASTVLVAVHDCLFDKLRAGPSVQTFVDAPMYYLGRRVRWVLFLSPIEIKQQVIEPESLFTEAGLSAYLPERVLAHELMHGLMSETLDEEHLRLSMARQLHRSHNVGFVTDLSLAFWEGFAIAAEPWVADGLPLAQVLPESNPWAVLQDRLQPVRDNAYVKPKSGERPVHSAEDLLRSEGFVATFTYRLLSHHHWTLADLVRVLDQEQPIQAAQWVYAITNDPQRELLRQDYLEISRFVTYVPQAQHFWTLLQAALAEHHQKPTPESAARAERLLAKWAELKEKALASASRLPLPNLARLAGPF